MGEGGSRSGAHFAQGGGQEGLHAGASFLACKLTLSPLVLDGGSKESKAAGVRAGALHRDYFRMRP